MAKKIDFSRSYGDVFGSERGVRYVQDEIEFDAHGHEMIVANEGVEKEEEKSSLPPASPKKGRASEKAKEVPPPPAAPTNDQVAAQLEG